MERERSTKIIAIMALGIAVIGLSVGFASWSANLDITDSEASVSKGNNDAEFKEKLKITAVDCETVEGSGTATSTGTFTDYNWTGAKISLTKQGDSVTCKATVSNESDFKAYFSDITIGSSLECVGEGQNVDAACNALELTVTGQGSGTSTATAKGTTITNATDIESNYIDTEETGTISFKLEYKDNVISDTDFKVTIPTMDFDFSTVD